MASVAKPEFAVSRTVREPIEWTLVLGVWCVSRLLIAAIVLFVSPHLTYGPLVNPDSRTGIEAFANWDGEWYERIATRGYDFAPDGKLHSVAFFPLYPLLIKALAFFGLTPVLGGLIVSNAAFVAALALLYSWTRERFGIPAARWAIVVLGTFPYSVFTVLVYTEALFLALSTAAMAAFDRGKYGYAAFFGALASATRIEGVVLVPAMLYAWIRDRRTVGAPLAALSCTAGLVAFMAYQYAAFGDALAFVHVQGSWLSHPTVDTNWLAMLAHPARPKTIIKVAMILGLGISLFAYRSTLPAVALAFGTCALALILVSGNTISPDRHIYGISIFSMLIGIILSRHARWGYIAVAVFVIWLAVNADKFALGRWVA